MNSKPCVTIIIPCFNEKKYIANCLDSIISGDYPLTSLEILVVDGMSTDGTQILLNEYAQKYSIIQVINNPEKIKPRALNIGIQAAKGEIIIRMDAHALYEPDYVSKSVRYLNEYKADNVGGIRKTLPSASTIIAKAIAYSISHPFAVGNATYRTGSNKMKWVDTVFGGCYRKQIFKEIGLFNEALIRGQDREFNVRLQRAGGKILLAPDIVCHYIARGDLHNFLEWIYIGGLTPFYISRITRQIIFSWRNLVPLAFVLSLSLISIIALFSPLFIWFLLGITAFYASCCLVVSIPIALRERNPLFLLVMPFIFATTHALYGIGSIAGMVKKVEYQTEWSRV